MWKIIQVFVCIFYINYVNATYNAGIKTRVYGQQTLTNVPQHYHQDGHHQTYASSQEHSNQYSGDDNDKAYRTTVTHHYAHTDNLQQQQQNEGEYYQQTPIIAQEAHHHRQYMQQDNRHQQPLQPQSQLETSHTQATENWQNSENSINEYYTGCPSGHTGQLPYAYDCRRFLNCFHGRGHIQTCSVGTVFNPETLECDRPDKVKCEAALGVLGVQSMGKSSSSHSHGNSKKPRYKAGRYTEIVDDSVEVLCPIGAEGLQPHPSNCTLFVNCANGNMHIQECGGGTAYSITLKTCDFKHKVDCSDREGGEDVSAHRQAENDISCPFDASGLYPHPYNCTKFLLCSNGETYIQECGIGTAFDSVRLLCDYNYKVKCCSTCTLSETEVSSESFHTSQSVLPLSHHISTTQHEDLPHTSDILCLSGLTGLFPYPFDYTKFIHCKNGNTAIQNCVSGTAFSISKGYCESLDKIPKSDHVMYIVSQVSHEYSQAMIICPAGTDGIHLYPFNAELFVKCTKSQMKILPCDNAQVFSTTRRTCLPAAHVLKHERVRLLSELESTSNYRVIDEHYNMENMVYCTGSLMGTYPHPFDSTKYLKCVRGRLISESCASGKAFSLSHKICSLKEEMNADDYVPQAKSIHGQEWSIANMEITHGSVDGLTYLMCPPGLEGYFLHPFDCTKYIKCASSGTIVENCVNGAVFSISRKECIPREKVEAYDRVEYMTTTKNEFTNEAKGLYHHDLGINCSPGTFGIYPHPYDCHKYIRCANGRLSVEHCGEGKVFSLEKSSCHNEIEVDQRDRTPYNRGFSVSQSHQEGSVTTNSNSYNSISILQSSLSPPYVESVLPPSVVLRPPLPPPENTVTTDNVSCPPGSTGHFPHPYECKKFLVCSNGITNIKECGPGTAWNSKMETCDFMEKVGCTERISTATSVANSDSNYRCPAGVEGSYQHPYDWHKYLVCSHGQTTIMACPAGTVFSMSRKICDVEVNVPNTDRCNNGVYSSDYDYNNRNLNAYGTFVTNTQGSYASTTQNQPSTQVTGNRWTNMNIPRPTYDQTSTWQHTTNTHKQNLPNTPGWSGAGVHVDQSNPTHTVIHEEGSLEPNRNYNRPMYNTPLAPLKPTTTTTTATLVYAQPVGSQEDSEEIFANNPIKPTNTFNPQIYPTSNRQNHTRHLNAWTPIRPVEIPQHNLMPPHQGKSTVYTNTHIQIPITSQLMPPYQTPQTSPENNYNIVGTHLKPSYVNEDSGQKPLSESEFQINTINVDQLPGQVSYNLDDFDQIPSSSSRHDTNDATNLYGGLQPPLAGSLTTTTQSFVDPYEQTTQVPPPPKTTFSSYSIFGYPQLSNATIQTFPRQPHYSPPYSEVSHSRNTSWVGRKVPQYSAVKPAYKDSLDSENSHIKLTLSANNEQLEDNPSSEDQKATMKEALKLLLKPYHKSKIDDEAAKKAQSHIMNLVSNHDKDTTTTSTATTHTPIILNQNTFLTSTIPHQEDVELILAGEQHSLVGVTTRLTGSRESSTTHNLYQTPLQPENPYNHDHIRNWHKDHHHDPHHSKVQHSREFHKTHPNLPNPFVDPADSQNPHTEATTPRAYDIDIRMGSECPFECGNGKCVEQHQVCDGVNNCGNRRDEQECEHLGYELRLTGGQSPNMGRVEVKILGKWGYVCDDKFGLRDADVVCRELGFKKGAMEVRGNSYYAPTDVNVYFAMDEVDCKGNETSLRECDFKGWGVTNCGPDEVVGVVCKVPKLKCPDNYWLCSKSKECIPTAFLCDVTPDCNDGSDESEEVCNAPIRYRLEGGRSPYEGRLEVFYRGEWGTVCDDDFGLKEAQVLCDSFGFYGKAEIVKNIYGPGSGPIWLDEVSCLGNETTIDECNHWSWGENNCNHTEDVGIKCTAGPKPNRAKENKLPTDDSSAQYTDLESTLQFEQSDFDDLDLYQGLWQRSSKASHSKKKCGHFKPNLFDEYEHPEERVVNGTIAKRGRHPWQATIRTRGRGGISSHWCGAVIISQKLILTAAHCLAGYPKGSYFVRVGDHYANIAESSEVDANIENWYLHEKFRDQKHMNNDIALILLKTPIRFNDYVQPVCLPEKGATLETNRMCTISGWGSIKSGNSSPSNILRSAQVPILANEICSQKNVYANAMTEGMFCAGFLDESADACDGDSGGPLVCSDEDGETLYGIISWGQHCGYANHPGVYVRVEKYIDWIYEKINLIMQQNKL